MSPLRRKGEGALGAVLVVGVGGLGTAAAIELLRSGVEKIGLADGDRVEVSNLHRQMLHGSADIGRTKAVVAAEKLAAAGLPSVTFGVHAERVTAANAAAILAEYQVVIDATDDPSAKFLLNDAAVLLEKPLVHAGVVGLEGQLLTIIPRESACLRCLFPLPPAADEVATCSQAGILGPLAGMIGALEAREAVKILSGEGELYSDRLLTIDARSLRLREIPVRRSPACPLCGPRATIHELGDPESETPASNPRSKETA